MADTLTPGIIARIKAGRGSGGTDLKADIKKALATIQGGSCLYDYIPQYDKESPAKHDRRRSKTADRHEPFPDEIASQYMETIYSGERVTRKAADPALTEYLNSDFATFMAGTVGPLGMQLHETYVIVAQKRGPVTSRAQTMADIRRERLYSGCQVIYGDAVRAYSATSNGEMEWVAFDAQDGDRKFVVVYDDTSIHILGGSFTPVKPPASWLDGWTDYPRHGFPMCPVVRVALGESRKYPGIGFAPLTSVVRKTVALLNTASNMVDAQELHLTLTLVADDRAIQYLEMHGKGNATPLQSQVAGTAPDFGTTKPIGVTPGPSGGIAPYYLELPKAPFEIMDKEIYERLPASIYRSARLRNREGGTASGTARVVDLQPELRAVAMVARRLSDIDWMLCRIIAAGSGVDLTTDNFTHAYPTEFDIKGTQESVLDAISIGDGMNSGALPQSDTLQKEYAKTIARRLLPNREASVYKQIDAEIDKWKRVEESPATDTIDPAPTNGGPDPTGDFAANLAKGRGFTAREARKAGVPR